MTLHEHDPVRLTALGKRQWPEYVNRAGRIIGKPRPFCPNVTVLWEGRKTGVAVGVEAVERVMS